MAKITDKDTDIRKLTVERSTATAHKLARYDGACANLHGHNIRWDVEVWVEMDSSDKSNMPLDLKDVSGILDQLDHELVLSRDDDMLEIDPVWGGAKEDADFPIRYTSEVYGPVWVFDGDPTCEVISQWAADELGDLEDVIDVNVIAYETDKYGVGAGV